eukprot:8961503-Pyramimonas_sp.AAC.1
MTLCELCGGAATLRCGTCKSVRKESTADHPFKFFVHMAGPGIAPNSVNESTGRKDIGKSALL